MVNLTLCCFPGACSRATMIALEETGARYGTRVVNIRAGGQKTADYLAINPKGKVPALIVDGTPLTENVAILSFLADSFPQAQLLPPVTEPMARAQALSAIAWLSSSVLPMYSRILRPQSVCDLTEAADRIAARANDEIRSQLALAERHMRDREWWVYQWSVADAYLFYIETTVERFGIDVAAFPALAAHIGRMKARPATQRTLAWEDQATKQLQAA